MRKSNSRIARVNFVVPSPYREMLDTIADVTLRSRPNAILILIEEEYRRRYPNTSVPGTESGAASMQASGLDRG